MNLDDTSQFAQIDSQNMLAEIDNLPSQLAQAWKIGQEKPLPSGGSIQHVVIAGMGGSAIGADLLAAFVAPFCSVPIFVNRDYDLPAWAKGPTTLVIASSHSGNTEETLSVFTQAQNNGCRLLAVTRGGKLGQAASQAGIPLWTFEHQGQPRAAVGFSFGLLLAALYRLGLIPDPLRELETTITAMQEQQTTLRAEVPVVRNPAKRLAGQLMGRWVVVMGAGHLSPVARRWKTQLNEIAKAWAQFEFLPEADHNTLAGLIQPEAQFDHSMVIFLQASTTHPRDQLRTELTRHIFMVEGLNTDMIQTRGASRLSQMWTLLHFGDYTAYYLAMAYGIDPSPVLSIENLKVEMGSQSSP
ncbi:MAG: bifunctional phosphoglucose/phosphomannose isomerase [Chloroflexota bacterium]